ncbi:MAG: hypothetical protein R3C26_19715 [Calditrichia bacterium]
MCCSNPALIRKPDKLMISNHLEPHHQLITDDDQVQIYQSVMGDVNGDVTHILLRGHQYLKDKLAAAAGFQWHRAHISIPPQFWRSGERSEFQPEQRFRGHRRDSIFIVSANCSAAKTYQIAVKVYYQTASPEFQAHLGSYATPEVATFMWILPSGIQSAGNAGFAGADHHACRFAGRRFALSQPWCYAMRIRIPSTRKPRLIHVGTTDANYPECVQYFRAESGYARQRKVYCR